MLGKEHLEAGHQRRARWRILAAYYLDGENPDVLAMLRNVRLGFFRRLFLKPAQKR
jgi:hypothetical protein